MKSRFRLGLIVNPIAGMGGKVGLHGTDGKLLDEARNQGATPISRERSHRALRRLRDVAGEIEIFAADGEMGYSLAEELGFLSSKIVQSVFLGRASHESRATFAEDTRKTATLMLARGVDLILFAGGDGTARDIHCVIGECVPILGIPTGVKMQSGVFATNPESAGDLTRAFILNRQNFPIREVEILDLAEKSESEDWRRTVYFGKVKAPYSHTSLQRAKSNSHSSGESGISSLCAALANTLQENSLYLYGPGTTTKRILAGLVEAGSTLGVDASLGKVVIGRDLSETQILELLATYNNATLFLGVIGGQGFLLGRGNQQISAAVVGRLNAEYIVLLASAEKIANLSPAVLQVDLGDQFAESLLVGYRKVHVAPGRSVMCKVVTPQRNEVIHVAV